MSSNKTIGGRRDALPETIAQARRFDSYARRYSEAGLCASCAAQAAWGHQLGHSKVNAPCAPCRVLVDCLPIEAAGSWRKLGSRLSAVSSRVCSVPDSSDAGPLSRTVSGAGRAA